MHPHVQRQQQVAESIVRGRSIILYQVTGNDGALGAPATVGIVLEHALQGRVRYNATQLAVRGSKKMRIRQVQDPDFLAVSCVTVGVNASIP
jgi:hypothetical protein